MCHELVCTCGSRLLARSYPKTGPQNLWLFDIVTPQAAQRMANQGLKSGYDAWRAQTQVLSKQKYAAYRALCCWQRTMILRAWRAFSNWVTDHVRRKVVVESALVLWNRTELKVAWDCWGNTALMDMNASANISFAEAWTQKTAAGLFLGNLRSIQSRRATCLKVVTAMNKQKMWRPFLHWKEDHMRQLATVRMVDGAVLHCRHHAALNCVIHWQAKVKKTETVPREMLTAQQHRATVLKQQVVCLVEALAHHIVDAGVMRLLVRWHSHSQDAQESKLRDGETAENIMRRVGARWRNVEVWQAMVVWKMSMLKAKDGARAERIIKRVGGRWRQKEVCNAVESWKTGVAKAKDGGRAERIMRRVGARWRQKEACDAVATWKVGHGNAKAVRRGQHLMRRVGARWWHKEMWRAVKIWVGKSKDTLRKVKDGGRAERIMRRVGVRWRFKDSCDAVNTWKGGMLNASNAKKIMRKVGKQWILKGVDDAVGVWRQGMQKAKDGKRGERIMRRVGGRWRQKEVCDAVQIWNRRAKEGTVATSNFGKVHSTSLCTVHPAAILCSLCGLVDCVCAACAVW